MVVRREDKVLLFRRASHSAHSGQWEFPGGKVDRDEKPVEALVREIREELGIEVKIQKPLTSSTNDSLELIPFLVEDFDESKIVLIDHDSMVWMGKENQSQFDILPLDLPIFNEALC
jgi:8-oxo-dGTP diphosphatase